MMQSPLRRTCGSQAVTYFPLRLWLLQAEDSTWCNQGCLVKPSLDSSAHQRQAWSCFLSSCIQSWCRRKMESPPELLVVPSSRSESGPWRSWTRRQVWSWPWWRRLQFVKWSFSFHSDWRLASAAQRHRSSQSFWWNDSRGFFIPVSFNLLTYIW